MTDPIGIRQNNPGNLRYGAGFEGEQEGDNGFGSYATPVEGGTALIKNLIAYNTKHGLNTVEGIISRWAPSTENDTAAYINAVSGSLGVKPTDALNMQDPGTLAKLATAISQHEGNGSVYNADFFQALSSNNPELATYLATQKAPPFLKSQIRGEAYRNNPNAPGEPTMTIGAQDIPGTAIEDAAALQAGQEVAANTRWAGLSESLFDSMAHNTITGTLVDLEKRGAVDPNFKIDDAHFQSMADAGVLQNKSLSDFVAGAYNQDDFVRRMEIAKERSDLFQRIQNTEGLKSAGVSAMQVIGGIADPVAILGTMGAGWAVNAARAGFALNAANEAIQGTRLASAIGGAAANVAIGQTVGALNNQTTSWRDLVAQGIQGAALGALLHTSTRTADPVMAGTHEGLQDTLQSGLESARQSGRAPRGEADIDDSISTELKDIPSQRIVKAPERPAGELGVLDRARAERADLLPVAGNYADPGVIAEARSGLENLSATEPDLQAITKEIQAAQGVSYKTARAMAKKVYDERMLDREDTRQRLQQVLDTHAAAENARVRLKELDAQIAEMERQRTAAGQLLTDRTPLAQAIHDLSGQHPIGSIFADAGTQAEGVPTAPKVKVGESPRPASAEREGPRTAGQSAVGEGRSPQVRRTFDGQGNRVGRFSRGETGGAQSPITDERYHQFVQQGVIEERHSSEMENVPADAKAVYVPADGKVYVLTDRLTPKDVADPTGLIMHEIGVHYGLEATLGTEQYMRVLGEVDNLAATDPKVRAAAEAVPADTPAHLRLEETLGYLAEQNPSLGKLARIVAGIRTWLRENIPLFGKLGMTANEVLRLVEGSVEAARAGTFRTGDVRYSRNAGPVYPTNAERVKLRMSKAAQDIAESAETWDETPSPENAAQRKRLKEYYDTQRVKLGADKVATWIDSPGLMLQRSKSKVARFLGAHLFEDAAGLGKREATVALDYERLQAKYKWIALPAIHENLVKGFTMAERAQYLIGLGKAAEDRVFRQVAQERLAHRAALDAGVKFESTAPEHIQKMAKALDDFFDKATADGKEAGNPYADSVRGGGFVGFMPYAWDWEAISRAHSTDAPRFAAFHENLTQQYTERIVEPAIDKLMSDNPNATAEEALKLRNEMKEKVSNLINNKISQLILDPESRVQNFDNAFENIAADVLKESFNGKAVDNALLGEFRQKLEDIRKDRSRVELDLTRSVNGTSLLDFMDYNAERMVANGAHRFAGLTALARKGFVEQSDAAGAIEAAVKSGATPEEIKALQFGFRAFGLGQLRNAERASFTNLRNATYMATMGKLGFSVVADASNVIAASGMAGFFRTLGGAFRKDSEFLKQLAVDAPSLLGQDYRLHALTPDNSANGRVLLGEGSNLSRMLQRGAQAISYLNGSNLIGKMLHRGFLPVFAEDMLRTIKGESGGMTPARMADVGLDKPWLDRIKAQLDQFDKDRGRGGRINWDKWTDQQAADKLIEAMHRGTFQTFQRAMVGEAPMWLSESGAGALFGQFRRYGIVSAEKQLARNVSILDSNTALAFTMGTVWAAMLYYARLHLNALGKNDAEARKYMADNTKGFRLAAGVFTLMNMSGVLPDAINLGELAFGGNSYQQVGSPVAAMGYLGNIGSAVHSLGNLATGQSTNRGSDYRAILRIAPGANTLMGTYLSNTTRH